MKRIGIALKPGYPEGEETLQALLKWLHQRRYDGVVFRPYAPEGHPSISMRTLKTLDMIIMLGGDGTLLSIARLLKGEEIPILAVNMGGLGFLTEITRGELYLALERIIKQGFIEDNRRMLESTVERNGRHLRQPTTLNDVIIHKGSLLTLIRLEISITNQFVSLLRADGLIIATATGSTAYSLSSGGPIVHPGVEAILLTTISPHILTHRPIVVPLEADIKVTVKTQEKGAAVTFDGQMVCPLQDGDIVHVRASPKRVKLICSSHRNYYQVLRQKLNWGDE